MIFIIDNQGTTKAVVLQEPIYQGSNNANRIILLAPIPSTNVPSASFMLPNGITTQPYVMTYFAGEMGENKNLNGWYLDVSYAITQYAGVVNIQFSIGTPQGTLKTYTSSFEVQQGILTLPPDQSVSGRNLYEEVLNRLAVVQGNTDGLRSEVAIIDGEVTTLKSNIKNAQSDIDNINNQIPNKVDKMPAHDTEHAYISIGGQDMSMPISHQIVPNSIVARDENGNTYFPYPHNYNDPATKEYVDAYDIKDFDYSITDKYELTLWLQCDNGERIQCPTIDLPIESLVVGAEYFEGKIILSIKNGTSIPIEITDLINGLVNTTDFEAFKDSVVGDIGRLDNGIEAIDKYATDNINDLNNRISELEQGGTGGGGNITVEQEVNDSDNPVSSKAVSNEFDRFKYAYDEIIDNVEKVAKGATRSVAYRSYAEMVEIVNIMSANEFKVGDHILIRTMNVPDLWVCSILSTPFHYSFVDDKTFINELNNIGVAVGHFVLAPLETQKVALDDYVTNDTFNKAVAKIEDEKQDKTKYKSLHNGTTITLEDNTVFIAYETIETLTIEFPSRLYNCSLIFDIADSDNFKIELPSNARYIGKPPAFNKGETWELNIMNNVVASGKVVSE